MRRVKFLRNPQSASFGSNVEAFLRTLGGPACFFIDGEDQTRTRALTTLLHGNEPSGVMAFLRWLQSGQRPAVNIVCIVASVAAALEPAPFSHRTLPRARDLNRCFKPPFDDAQGALAEEILEILHLHNPEAVVDMHNTSGSGPSFGVCTHMDRHHDALVSLFTQRLIVSNLRMGALMDISEHHYPTVTVEVGGRLDEEAHELAYEGMCRYFTASTVLDGGDTDWALELLCDPIRLELLDGISLTYADEPNPAFDVTLRTDIENHNFGGVSIDTVLGWAKVEEGKLFSATDAEGRCAVNRIVRVREGLLYPAQPLKLFMITNNAAIAEADCLFYAVADDGSAIGD